MGMVVRTNTMALNAYRQLGMNNSAVAKSLEKLSSGFRINRAGDDAAGLAISEKMKAQITGLETASSNAQDGISLIQTAEGNLTEVHSMLNRMVELATKSSNGTYQDAVDRDAITAEVEALNKEIDRISKSANFNGINLLDGTTGLNTKAFDVGEATKAAKGQAITLTGLPAQATTPDAATAYHLTKEGGAQKDPSFVVDLADFNAKLTTSDTATISIGGETFTLTPATDITTGAELVSEFVTGLANGTAIGATEAASDGTVLAKIGGLRFTVSAVADESNKTTRLKFEYHSKENDVAAGTDNTVFTTTDAATFNTAMAKHFSVSNGTTGLVDHATTLIDKAVAKVDSQRAGIELNITDYVKDGVELKIDGKTFVFQTLSEGSAANSENGKIVIDVSKAAADQVKEAVLQMANTTNAMTPTNFQIGAASATSIHVDQKIGSTEKYKTYDDLVKIFSAKGTDSAASSQLTVNTGELKNGNAISIGGKKFTFVTEGADATNNEINLGDNAMKDFETLLKSNGFGVVKNGDTFTISDKAAPSAAPAIAGAGLVLQIGDTGSSYNKMTVQIGDMGTGALKLDTVDVSNADAARASIDTIKAAINTVSTARANMGALQNRLEHTINNLDVAAENLSAANSRIRDTDMAKEMMNYTKMNVLVQSAQAMLAQANQQPQSVLQLLQ